MKKMQTSFHEGRTIGLLLTFIGGAMDSYTYIQYGAFASAQTGNIILSIIQAFDGEWLSVGKKVLSTLFFFLGILLTKYLIDYFRKKENSNTYNSDDNRICNNRFCIYQYVVIKFLLCSSSSFYCIRFALAGRRFSN